MVKEGVTPRVTDGSSEDFAKQKWSLLCKWSFANTKWSYAKRNENTYGVVKGVELKKSELGVHSFCFKKHKLLDKHDTIWYNLYCKSQNKGGD